MKVPVSTYEKTLGMLYFARMLDKIRKMDKSELREDFHGNLGEGIDARCVKYLRVKYDDLVKQTLLGGSDEEVLQWCYQAGRELDANDIFIWNQFVSKFGWRCRG